MDDYHWKMITTAVSQRSQQPRRAVSAPAEAPAVEDQFQLREAFDSIPSPTHRTGVRLLADNQKAWNARWKLLESAQETINAQYYTWDHDIFGKAQLGHVFLRARQGVDVRVMVDAVGDTYGTRGFKSHIGGEDYLQELVALPNAEAKVYHPHYQKLPDAILHPTGMQGLAANHDKILEIDGQAGTIGGRNTGHQYFIHPKDDPTAWRDGDILLEGSAAAHELRDAFEEEYDQPGIHHTVRPDLLGNWRKRDVELLGAYALMDQWLKAPALPESEKNQVRACEETRNALADQMVSQVCDQLPELGIERIPSKRERKALQAMARELAAYTELRGTYNAPEAPVTPEEVKIIDKTSAVGSGLNEMNNSLIGLLKGAQHSILIQTPYYVLTDPVIDALKEAGERDVNIRVATNSPSNTDSYFTQAFFLNDWEKSLATIPNLELFAATGERKHHAKMAVIDEQVAVVGTYNLDLVSAAVNGEVAAVVWSPDFAHQVTDTIAADFQDETLGYKQYQIARDTTGNALDKQGAAVLDGEGNLIGKPAAVFGPDNHVDPKNLLPYDKKIRRWNWARHHLPQLQSTERFAGGYESRGQK